MDIIQKIRAKAAGVSKTIVLPEYGDSRTLEAVKIIEKNKIANILLLTKDKIIASEKEKYIQQFYELNKPKGLDLDAVRNIFEDNLYYAAMMTREGKVDGFVAGATHTTADTVRAGLRCLGINEKLGGIACSCFIMAVPNCPFGQDGTFVFADCGIVPDPSPKQLASISLSAAELARKVLDFEPRVGFLSYSTHGSAKGRLVQKITEAIIIAKGMAPNMLIDGELQVDAAIVPEVAKIKYPDSVLAGRANVLIFPNLEAGNISYKLVQRLANARAIGPIMMGLGKPCSDLSRGCIPDDIVDCVAVTAIRAQ